MCYSPFEPQFSTKTCTRLHYISNQSSYKFCQILLIHQDTIHTVYYAWAMQQVDLEELSEGAMYPIWKVREMQQFGVQALI